MAERAPGHDLLRELFSSRMRAAVLTHVLPRPHLRFSLTDLSRLLDQPISSLQHECYKLERLGILRGRRDGNSRRYEVVAAFPLRTQLTALVAAAIGPDEALRAALEQVGGLDAAFLACGLPLDPAALPARVVLIGEMPLEEIDGAQERAALALGLAGDQVETVFYRTDDWRDRLAQGSAFARGLLSGPRVDLWGDPALLGVPAEARS